jgi:hypothetical protein
MMSGCNCATWTDSLGILHHFPHCPEWTKLLDISSSGVSIVEEATPMVQIKDEDFKRLMAVVTAARKAYLSHESTCYERNSHVSLYRLEDWHCYCGISDLEGAIKAYETAENDRGKGKEND